MLALTRASRGALQRALGSARVTGPFIGIDVGTSGVKALAIDGAGTVHARAESVLPAVDAEAGLG